MNSGHDILLWTILVAALTPVAAAQKAQPIPEPPPVIHSTPPPPGHPDDVMANLNRSTLRDAEKQREDTCLLPPLDSIRSSVVSAAQLRIPTKAKREYQRACSALTKKRSSDAEQYLRKSTREYPKYAAAWVTLGQVLADEHRTEDATSACAQAATADPMYLHAQLCLAEIASLAQEWGEELKYSRRAIELDRDSVLAYEYHAAADANLGNLSEAERNGLRAVALDQDHEEPSVFFLLAQIYELKGDAAREQEEFRQFLKYTHNRERAATAKKILAELENGRQEERVSPEPKNSPDAGEASAQRRKSENVEESAPPVVEDTACPLTQILRDASQRETELVENLQRFTAAEQIEHTEFGKNGKPRRSDSELFSYLAEIKQNRYQGFSIYEYRTEKGQSDPPPLADTGTAGLALLFHPKMIGNLEIHCEGQTDLQGSAAWQLRFVEGPDERKSFSELDTKDSTHRIRLKGRAWISADNYQVLRLETDLAAPMPEINLQVYHFDVSYSPLEFAKHQFRVWLPESASLNIEYQSRRYQRVHRFSHFQLFLVNTEQRVTEPDPQTAKFELTSGNSAPRF